jgi:hypothetical protein
VVANMKRGSIEPDKIREDFLLIISSLQSSETEAIQALQGFLDKYGNEKFIKLYQDAKLYLVCPLQKKGESCLANLLHYAIIRNYPKFTKLLLENGVDINAGNTICSSNPAFHNIPAIFIAIQKENK